MAMTTELKVRTKIFTRAAGFHLILYIEKML